MGITQGIHSKTTIWLGEKKIQKRERKEMGQKLALMEKFLGMRKLEGGAIVMRAPNRKRFPTHLNT